MVRWTRKCRLLGLNFWKVLICFTLLMSTVAFGAAAAEKEGEKPDQEEASRHRVELFLGDTHDEGEDAFSVGLAYEYRLNKLIGLGLFWEVETEDFDQWSVGVPLFLHPYRGLRFQVAPGIEHKEGDKEFLVRLGVAYEFEMGGSWSLTPEFNVDFVDGEEAAVFGVSLGYGF